METNIAHYGWVYILEHPQQPYLKIGFTRMRVADRIKSLEQATGALPGYKTAYAIFVEKPQKLEALAHKTLRDSRVYPNKEFFDLNISLAINTLKDLCAKNSIEIMKIEDPEVNSQQAEIEREKLRVESEREKARRDEQLRKQKHQENQVKLSEQKAKNLANKLAFENRAKVLKSKTMEKLGTLPAIPKEDWLPFTFIGAFAGLISPMYFSDEPTLFFILIAGSVLGVLGFSFDKTLREEKLVKRRQKQKDIMRNHNDEIFHLSKRYDTEDIAENWKMKI